MARCLLPIPLSLRHSCVCLYEDLSNSTLDPFPTSPFHPRGAFAILPCHYHPVPLSPQAFSTSGRRGPRVMIVFVHPLHGGGGRRTKVPQSLSFLVSIPDFRCERCITAKCIKMQREKDGERGRLSHLDEEEAFRICDSTSCEL